MENPFETQSRKTYVFFLSFFSTLYILRNVAYYKETHPSCTSGSHIRVSIVLLPTLVVLFLFGDFSCLRTLYHVMLPYVS